jgi:hypothetical protein
MMKNCSISVLGQQLTKENALVRFALRTVPHKEIGLAHQTSIVFHKSKVASFIIGFTSKQIYHFDLLLRLHVKLLIIPMQYLYEQRIRAYGLRIKRKVNA